MFKTGLSSKIACLITAVLLTCTVNVSYAELQTHIFKDSATETRYQKIIAELRCLVCQNQNLADSNADLAKDLRNKTAEMLKQGKTDQQILDYMRDRYGDFVLYRPPFSLKSSILWLGPFALLLIAITMLMFNIRKRQRDELARSAQTNDEEQLAKVRNILKNAPELDKHDNP